jgi:hypothetical protein
MSQNEQLIDIETAAFVAKIGALLVDRKRHLPDGGTIHVSRVEFTYEDDEGLFDGAGLPFLRRQGLHDEYPLAMAVETL